MTDRDATARLDLLDYARFFAAMSVVAFHYLFNGITNGKLSSLNIAPGAVSLAKYGYLGVDFFFLVSGYVIYATVKNKSSGAFLVSRCVRLFPMLWFSVVATSLIVDALGTAELHVTVQQAAANLTMFPFLFGQELVDGVYWTLEYEWKFYFLILLFILLKARDRLIYLFMAWPFWILFWQLAGKSHVPYADGYFGYFAAGALFAARAARESRTTDFCLLAAVLACMIFSVSKAESLSAAKGFPFSAFVIAMIVMGAFLFFIVLDTAWARRVRLPAAKQIGALTYPLYLMHAHIGYTLLSRFATEENKWFSYLAVTTTMVLTASVAHVVIERSMAKFWHRVFRFLIVMPLNAADHFINSLVQKLGRIRR